ncbi:hypothetical protein A33Y_0166 [Candidatus Carsonella ruddii CS isolate Thao2000]|uniref:Uncharacterized protein n=1 Tax=Candidatus Carsonella ruddii CS isolate Thao2000 TaxID=1202537 RepID=J7GYW7_CARRU|nr:hypothetical protein [Candidatus Carsonella ruddii]AFP83803.1 hypothetical protein A33Y_0166 [Candidatus Carsonella ruddii CS isolate Thao2000]
MEKFLVKKIIRKIKKKKINNLSKIYSFLDKITFLNKKRISKYKSLLCKL